MRSIPVPLRALMVKGNHRFVSCVRIARTDGVTLRFTDHMRSVVLPNDGTYNPASAVQLSARQKLEGFKVNNSDVQGVVTDSQVSESDLREGKYRNAVVTETVVDYRYPWLGAIDSTTYTIQKTTFDGKRWNAEIAGIAYPLTQALGSIAKKQCTYRLGDSNCGVSVATVAATVVSVIDPRLSFTVSTTGFDTGYFSDGTLVRGTLEEAVKEYREDGRVTLHLRSITPVTVGQNLTLRAGCDGLIETCKERFNNVVNFGGEPDIPGGDTLYDSPDPR